MSSPSHEQWAYGALLDYWERWSATRIAARRRRRRRAKAGALGIALAAAASVAPRVPRFR